MPLDSERVQGAKADRFVEIALRVTSYLCAALVAGCGFCTLGALPASVSEIGPGRGTSLVWSLMLLCGGLSALYGMARAKPVPEAAGWMFVAGGFFVWAFAIFAALPCTWATTAGGLCLSYAMLVSLRAGIHAVSSMRRPF